MHTCLVSQINLLCEVEERMTSAERNDKENSELELSDFLKEMACPYSDLILENIKDFFKR